MGKIFVIFHTFAEKPLHRRIFMKFGTGGRFTDVINCVKFFADRFRSFDSASGRFSAISIDLGSRH